MTKKRFELRAEAFGTWLARSRIGPKITKNPNSLVITSQWVLVGLYFPFAYVSQWIPLVFILFMSWWGGTFYAWREVIKSTAPDTGILGIGALLSTIVTDLLKFIFLFAALFDLFGTIKDGDRLLDGVWSHVYFSAVTITTLGYGNLVPEGMLSEILAAIEAVIGFLFFAVVAGLSATIIVDRIRHDS